MRWGVAGFTEGTDERRGTIHDLLIALMRADGTFHVLARVGGGFTDAERRQWLCDLQDWVVGSDHVETNDGVAYQMVWPQHVIELSVLDVIAQTTRGQPIPQMCLEWQSSPLPPREDDRPAAGCWHGVRKLPGAALISPQFVRRRDDKRVTAQDVRLAQVTALVELPLADRDARACELPKSELLRRGVWTKPHKGQTMVRKLMLWQTHKEQPLVVGGPPDWPAYVIAVTDYSPGREAPLQRDIRVSNSREQIEELWNVLVKEKVVKGWVAA